MSPADHVDNMDSSILRTRLVRAKGDFAPLSVVVGMGEDAVRYGNLVYEHSQLPGAHNTPAAEEGNDIISHEKGKYGELLFAKWLDEKSLTATHTPFRNDYSRKVLEDDFIVGGINIEVKTKRRGVDSPFPPALRYNVNMGRKGLEHDIYVFIEVDPKGELKEDPSASIVGWATPPLIRKFGIETWPGKRSDNGKFEFQRYDWDIEIRYLYKPVLLAKQFAPKASTHG